MNFIDQVKASGIVGAGGAGFPSHVKFNAKASCFIVNGIECEPLLETDKYYMRHHTPELVAGMGIIGKQLEADRLVIGIKSKNKREIEAVENEIAKQGLSIEVHKAENYYPAGDEQMLIKDVTGKSVPQASIPISVGVVVSNVATVIDVYNSTKGKSVTRRVITVTGAVKSPTLINVPIGTSIQQCVDLAGGTALSDYKVILGGPMMGQHCLGSQTASVYTTKTLGGIIVLPSDHHIFLKNELTENQIIKRAASTCIQCRMCTDLCPRYMNGHPLEPHKIMRAVGSGVSSLDALRSVQLCCECGVCEMYACPMEMSPKKMNQAVKGQLRAHNLRYELPGNFKTEASDMRGYRKVQTDRLIARLGLSKYSHIHLDEVVWYDPNSVRIKLSQHIGHPAVCVVSEGTEVSAGDCIADIPESALGAPIHASIAGIVTAVQDYIEITVNT